VHAALSEAPLHGYSVRPAEQSLVDTILTCRSGLILLDVGDGDIFNFNPAAVTWLARVTDVQAVTGEGL